MNDQEAFAVAVEEANLGYQEGGVPVTLSPPHVYINTFIHPSLAHPYL